MRTKKERKKNARREETLIIKQGGLDPISYEKLIQVNKNGKKIEISSAIEEAHIEGFAENSKRYNPQINSEEESNLTMLRIDNHRNIDNDNPENYPVEELKLLKKEIEEKTSDKNVYKVIKSCDCSYIHRKKTK